MEPVAVRKSEKALKAYVVGDSSEPVLLSEFRGVSFEDRHEIVNRHRDELESIDRARLVILESMLLSIEHRRQ